jgi:uncharacterized protein YjbI with pentapeptide repeats
MTNKLSVKMEDIAGSEFEDLNMAGAQFTNINLCGSRFHDINFSDAQITAVNIGGLLFKHIGPMPDKDGKMDRQRPVTFEEGMLCDSTFLHMDLSNVKIIECNISGMTIDGIEVADLIKEWKKSHA